MDETKCEDEIDRVQQDCPSIVEDCGGQGDPSIVRPRSPRNAQDVGDGPRYAKTKKHSREDELVVYPFIELENGHVCRSPSQKQNNENGIESNVDMIRYTTDAGGRCWIGSMGHWLG